jgi:uncharacterized membrane protein
MMYEPLLIIMSGLMDRVRGDAFHFFARAIDKLVYGWIIAALFLHPFDWLTPAIMVAFLLGSSPGWGDTMGAILEKRKIFDDYDRGHFWQVGILRRNKWAAAFVRGAIWGAPIAALGYFDPVLYYAVPVYIVAYVGSLVFSMQFLKGSWGHAETVRGLMAGALIWLTVLFS